MNFLGFSFLVFFAVTVIIYYLIKPQYRYLCLLAASYYFYAQAGMRMVMTLMFATGLTYIGGALIKKNKKWFWPFFIANISILLFYKYTGFILENINIALGRLGIENTVVSDFNIIVPMGLSFYIFQSTTYLGDIRNGKISVVKNILKYAAFVSFFPTVVSGPIQKARNLIPQLECNVKFQYDNALKGSILILYGFFEKIVVSNNLAVIVNEIFDNWQNYTGVYYLIAAMCFSFQIYSDFSAYSDIARGIAKILGIDVGKNFDNPYLSQSVAEFWKRWHTSLNSWFVEYIYIPLGGSKKGILRQYVNVMIVFLISGLWHGASKTYVLWGGVNGIFQLVGDARKRMFSISLKKGINGYEYKEKNLVFIRRIVVFMLITITWVFFRIPGVRAALHIIKNMLLFYPIQWFDPKLLTLAGDARKTIVTIMVLIMFILLQYIRKEEGKYYMVFTQQLKIVQILILALAVYIVFFASISGSAVVNTQFIYFQF